MQHIAPKAQTALQRRPLGLITLACTLGITAGCTTKQQAPLEITNKSTEPIRVIARVPYTQFVSIPLGYPHVKGPYAEQHRATIKPSQALWVGQQPKPGQVHDGRFYRSVEVAIEQQDENWLFVSFNSPPARAFRLTIDRNSEGVPTVVWAEPGEIYQQILSFDDATKRLKRDSYPTLGHEFQNHSQ